MDRPNDIDRLLALAASIGQEEIKEVRPLTADASTRRYYRIFSADGSTLIGAIGKSTAENRAFVEIAAALARLSIAAPVVMACEKDYGAYLMTDLGDSSMMDLVTAVAKDGQWEGSKALKALEACMDSLPKLQLGLAREVNPEVCYPRPAMDRRSVMWDLNHFKYCFLKAVGAEPDEEGLENDFARIASMIESLSPGPLWAFIHRDSQSRNVMMLSDGTPAWIDFQGGRMGPVGYDLFSMVWHARAALPEEVRFHLLDRYLESLSRQVGKRIGREEFMQEMRPVLLLRYLQVLGAYGLRGLTEGKAAFITPIPTLISEMVKLLPWMKETGLSTLSQAVERLPQLPIVKEISEQYDELVVTVTSFSYKRGLPRDYSGNGGGFIFDCRYPNNPGRYEQYKHLTGRDREVIDFIEADGELPELVNRAIDMVMPAVERYRQRGFTRLSVAFGCTGGRHRSVYGAEQMTRVLRSRGLRVRLIHREQGIDEML